MENWIPREREAVIVAACRTPIGRYAGALASVRPDDLLANAFREAVQRAHVEPVDIDEVIAGCGNQAGEDNRNVARMASLLAGFPDSVPGVTTNRLCGSGMESIHQAARQIMTGDADIVVAGGVESMTRAPWVQAKPDRAYTRAVPPSFDTALGWRFPNAEMAKIFPLESMGETAENVAQEWKIGRAEQDGFALDSHQKAAAAWSRGVFADEVFPVRAGARGDVLVDVDESPRPETTLEKLASLRPVFRADGTVTAGNSSPLNDGAAAVVLMSRREAESRGVEVMACIRASASAGVSPRLMGVGPVPATRKALTRAGMSMADMDIIELNEAFAAQALAVLHDLDVDPTDSRVNPQGGAIALGHPIGASGARVVGTLAHQLVRGDKEIGLATMCIGVGQGIATVLTRT